MTKWSFVEDQQQEVEVVQYLSATNLVKMASGLLWEQVSRNPDGLAQQPQLTSRGKNSFGSLEALIPVTMDLRQQL